MCAQSNTEKYLESIRSFYTSTTTTTSQLCRTIVFALIASVWVLFQQQGVFTFERLPTIAIGLLGIYICIDVFQYFASASSYFVLYSVRKKIGEKIGYWQHKVDNILYCIFLVKILYLLVIMIVCVCATFTLKQEDILKAMEINTKDAVTHTCNYNEKEEVRRGMNTEVYNRGFFGYKLRHVQYY